VVDGLSCQQATVSAELYKLLVYDTGGFFASHRDTEKVEGMFSTLVIVLPSSHSGGELMVRHAGREVIIDLSTPEVSQLSYAAFYADCEHEVRPISAGNRVCLIYNLIAQSPANGRQKPLMAPDCQKEITAAAGIIEEAMRNPSAPRKLVYLLEHQYTPAGLSFSGLKNADAARSRVLVQAGERAGCAVHLGIVHLEESGAAEIEYDPRYRRLRWRSDEDNDEDEDSSQAFTVIDVCDARQYAKRHTCTSRPPRDSKNKRRLKC